MSHALQSHTRWWIIGERSEKTWSTGGGNGKPLQYSCLENLMNSMKREIYMTLEDKHPQVIRCPVCYQGSSVQVSHSIVSDFLQPHGLQQARPPCPSPTSRVYTNSYPLSHWCHPMISSSIIPFSSHLQSFPASGSFLVNQFFASRGQTREEQKAITNISRKNEVAGPKRKQCSVVDVSGSESNVQCCKEQYWIGSWSVQSMNQGKLDVVKQEIARVNIDILGICEWKWTRMGKFNSDDHYIYYCVQEYLKRNGVALKVNKKAWNTVFECSLKKDKIISFISKANHSTSTVIQVYAPTINAKEAEANWFDEVLQHLELIP